MNIEDIDSCHKCGVLFDRTITLNEESEMHTDYHTEGYKGNCPACKTKLSEEW